MYREIGDWVISEENRKERMLLADQRMFSLYGENMLGDLEKSSSVIWRNRVWRFGEIVFGDLEKS